MALGSELAFFFQAEDGIRDFHVTGVQTCALPIFLLFPELMATPLFLFFYSAHLTIERKLRLFKPARSSLYFSSFNRRQRSEERRVGKECSIRWESYE